MSDITSCCPLSVSLSPSSRRSLYLVNLDAPSEPSRKMGRHSKWDVGTVQWNPHRSQAHIFAASSNQRVDLYSWRDGCGETHTSLQGHTRVISDLDWSWFDPELLVSSSVDTYMYIWDTRDTRKPTVALSAVAGAAQVKWNRRNPHLLASSHDGDVRIWDKRKPNTAVEYLAAHLSKIHGLDWHRDNEFVFATSSQDNSVRFWDYRQPRKYLSVLSCQVPVWKARYTPFSSGLVTVMVPQLRRENSLLLWSVLDLNSPVHAFVGHDDVVLEFQWRPQKEGSRDFQLVTWSRDQTLRIWRVEPQLQKLCVSDLVDELMEDVSIAVETEKSLGTQQGGAPASDDPQGQAASRPDPTAGSGLTQTLQQEFSLVNLQIRNVNVEMDARNRSCVVSAHFGGQRVHLVVNFPVQYPNNAAPSFQFVAPTTIPSAMKTKIQKVLMDTSLQKVKRNQNCLEPCVRQLVSCLESDMVRTQEDGPASGPFVLSNPVAPSLQAFPRGRAGNHGNQAEEVKDLLPDWLLFLPFVLFSSVVFFSTNRCGPASSPLSSNQKLPMSTSRRWSVQTLHDWPKSRRFKTKREGAEYSSRPIKLAGKVIIQEISCLLPVHKALGESYILNMNDIQETCQKNAAAALAVGRRDLAKVSIPPSPRRFSEAVTPPEPLQSPSIVVYWWSCSGLLLPLLAAPTLFVCVSVRDPEHSAPWGESSPDDYRYGNQSYMDPRERERELHDMNKRLLDPANTLQFDDFKKSYGEILYRWGLGDKRADVLKFTAGPPEPHKGIEFGLYCCHCRSQARGTQCAVCKRLTFQCAVCHVAVRGSSNFCLSCGHGGHTGHMMDWFRRQDECPAGCGCRCLLQSTF
uniref:WD repeat domain 59 n=1 Tax=Poecilia reticulata TaxID=8081 RepID=A0A3P9NQX9_POERE